MPSNKLPSSPLHCKRCNAPLGVRWKNRSTGKYHNTMKWQTHPIGGENVPVCSPCKGELMTGNHAPKKRMHSKPLIGQLDLFTQEQIEVIRPTANRKHRPNA